MGRLTVGGVPNGGRFFSAATTADLGRPKVMKTRTSSFALPVARRYDMANSGRMVVEWDFYGFLWWFNGI